MSGFQDISNDRRTLERIASGDRQAFEKLFHSYYESLFIFSCSLCGNREIARDVLQDVFFSFWQRRNSIRLEGTLKSYLFRAVKNRTYDHIRKRKTRRDFRELRSQDRRQEEGVRRQHEVHDNTGPDTNSQDDIREQLVQEIWTKVQNMSPKRRRVFLLYRKHGLSYREIAYVLDISVKTVENHMGRALEVLRSKLRTDRSSTDKHSSD